MPGNVRRVRVTAAEAREARELVKVLAVARRSAVADGPCVLTREEVERVAVLLSLVV